MDDHAAKMQTVEGCVETHTLERSVEVKIFVEGSKRYSGSSGDAEDADHVYVFRDWRVVCKLKTLQLFNDTFSNHSIPAFSRLTKGTRKFPRGFQEERKPFEKASKRNIFGLNCFACWQCHSHCLLSRLCGSQKQIIACPGLTSTPWLPTGCRFRFLLFC